MKIFLGSDHAGYELKGKIFSFLSDLGYEVCDKGAFQYTSEDDYPDFIAPVAEEVSRNPKTVRGIIIGASGQGEAILANKFPGVRAVVFYGEPRAPQIDAQGLTLDIIESTRMHNDANVLSLGARFLSDNEAKIAVKKWLETAFSGEERHIRRIEKIKSASLKIYTHE